MFTIDYSPKSFDDIVGQHLVKKILNAVLHSPDKAPKTYLFNGSWGLGKTAIARIFGKAINCESQVKPCYTCDSCLSESYYTEYDSSITGNVQTVKQLRESWYYGLSEGYKVIVFDEMQVVSPAAQSNLLEVFGNPPNKTFFLVLTTNPEKLLKPVISRCMSIEFNLLTYPEIVIVIDRILEKESIRLSEETKRIIYRRSLGHARDAVMLIEKAIMIGEDIFKDQTKLNDKLLSSIFGYMLRNDITTAEKLIKRLCESPVTYLSADLENFIKILLHNVVGCNKVLYGGLLDEKLLMKVLNYYVRVKPLFNNTSTDFYTGVLGFKTILKIKDSNPVFTGISKYSKI